MSVAGSSDARFLQDEEARALLRELRSSRSWTVYAAAVLMLNLGLRVGEVVTLPRADVSARGRSLSVRTLKRRRRVVHTFDVPESVARVLRRAKQRAEDLAPRAGGAGWLFPGWPPSRGISARAIQRTLSAAAARAGIERRITPHMLRHTRAMAVWATSHDRALVTHDLRHADARSAETYIHADPARYREAARKIRALT